MKRIVLALMFLLAGGALQTAAAAETTYDRVLRTGTLRCGWATWAPFIVKDTATGKMSGIYVDIIEEMARRLSLKVDWSEESPVSSYVEGIAFGRYDMGCVALSIVAARARAVSYTQPLYYSPIYLAVRADDARFDKGYDGLNDEAMKVAVQDGEISSIVAQQTFPKARPVSIPQMSEYAQLFAEVATGKADAALVGPSDLDVFIKNNPGVLKRLDPPVSYLALAFPTPKSDFAFNSMMRDSLTELQADGTIRRIFSKYPGILDYYPLPEAVRR